MGKGRHIGVIGAGAWGTALAQAACHENNRVCLWSRNGAVVDGIRKSGENTPYLKGVPLAAQLEVTDRLDTALKADTILLAVPAQSVRSMALQMASRLAPTTPVVLCAKGIERHSGLRGSQILHQGGVQAIPVILSGPGFAADVARGLPTAVSLACGDIALAESLAQTLFRPTLRPYPSDDVIGVEFGGALKNVLAIAAGIVEGRALGASARAALTARGFAEMVRFARHFGARPETLMGLSGLGDLVLTASSTQSRNYRFGRRLGQGVDARQAAAGFLVEGAYTAHIVHELAIKHAIDLPITQIVVDILSGHLSIDEAITALLSRPIRGESIPTI